MLNKIICCLVFAFSFNVKAEIRPVQLYQLVDSQKMISLPSGKCLITGLVSYADPFKGIGGIYNQGMKLVSEVNDKGEYAFLMDCKDSLFFFFHAGMTEIVVPSLDFKEKHHYEINLTPFTSVGLIIADKPVIYAYSDTPVHASIDFDFYGNLLFSHPLYNNGWDIEVNENGILYNDLEYPYLFWEGSMDYQTLGDLSAVDNSFIINTDSSVSFLEMKLTEMGLNRREQTDFITYWVPRMIDSPFGYVQFLLDTEYEDRVASLNVSPKPDNIKRVYMLFTPYSVFPNGIVCKDKVFEPFEREGFSLVEWGGSIIKTNKDV